MMKKPSHNAAERTVRGRGVARTHLAPDDVPAPSRAEARRRIRSKPGFFETLSPEALEAIKNFDGPEVLGPPREHED